MNIHEYQGKAVLKAFGVAVPRGVAIFAPLPQYVQEQLARHLVPVLAMPGDAVIREGEPGTAST